MKMLKSFVAIACSFAALCASVVGAESLSRGHPVETNKGTPAMRVTTHAVLPKVPSGTIVVGSALSQDGNVYARLLAYRSHIMQRIGLPPLGQSVEIFERQGQTWKPVLFIHHNTPDMNAVRIYQNQGHPALVEWDWTDVDAYDTVHLEVYRIPEGGSLEHALDKAMKNAVVLPDGAETLMMQPMAFGSVSPLMVTLENGHVEVRQPDARPSAHQGQLFLQVQARVVQHHPEVIEIDHLPTHLYARLHQDIVLTAVGDAHVLLGAALDREYGDPGGFYSYQPAPYANCLVVQTEEKGQGVLVISPFPGSFILIHGEKKPFVSIPITIS